jgi:regulator of protease activity HflC (stomatin/prohibitin superfamily)
VKFQAQQAIAQATGVRNSTIAQAEGNAEATKLNAAAEAYKIQLIQLQLLKSPQYIEYVKASRWTGILPQFYMSGGSNPLIMQLPSLTDTSVNQ